MEAASNAELMGLTLLKKLLTQETLLASVFLMTYTGFPLHTARAPILCLLPIHLLPYVPAISRRLLLSADLVRPARVYQVSRMEAAVVPAKISQTLGRLILVCPVGRELRLYFCRRELALSAALLIPTLPQRSSMQPITPVPVFRPTSLGTPSVTAAVQTPFTTSTPPTLLAPATSTRATFQEAGVCPVLPLPPILMEPEGATVLAPMCGVEVPVSPVTLRQE